MNWLRRAAMKLVHWRRRLASAALILAAVALLAHVMTGSNGWMAYRQKKVEYQKLQQEVQRIQEENSRLDGEIRSLRSDPKAIEREAREQLRYAKPGEVIYLLPEQSKPAATPAKNETAKR